jgi:nucleoside 2-deoxyribosyltransferase
MNISKGWTIFVISPFGGYFDAVFEYGLKSWFNSFETEVIIERADTYPQLTEDLIEKIQTRIRNADLIIADTTDGRPNVMYEIGFADAIGKRIIYLCQNTKEIPFDIAP